MPLCQASEFMTCQGQNVGSHLKPGFQTVLNAVKRDEWKHDMKELRNRKNMDQWQSREFIWTKLNTTKCSRMRLAIEQRVCWRLLQTLLKPLLSISPAPNPESKKRIRTVVRCVPKHEIFDPIQTDMLVEDIYEHVWKYSETGRAPEAFGKNISCSNHALLQIISYIQAKVHRRNGRLTESHCAQGFVRCKCGQNCNFIAKGDNLFKSPDGMMLERSGEERNQSQKFPLKQSWNFHLQP